MASGDYLYCFRFICLLFRRVFLGLYCGVPWLHSYFFTSLLYFRLVRIVCSVSNRDRIQRLEHYFIHNMLRFCGPTFSICRMGFSQNKLNWNLVLWSYLRNVMVHNFIRSHIWTVLDQLYCSFSHFNHRVYSRFLYCLQIWMEYHCIVDIQCLCILCGKRNFDYFRRLHKRFQFNLGDQQSSIWALNFLLPILYWFRGPLYLWFFLAMA